jgi:NAD+ kinase
LKVAIYSRVLESTQQKDVQLFFDELDKEQIIPVLFSPYLKEIERYISLPSSTQTFTNTADLTDDIDFLISLGGDGTLLDTVTLIRNKRIPVVGINFGRLGF